MTPVPVPVVNEYEGVQSDVVNPVEEGGEGS